MIINIQNLEQLKKETSNSRVLIDVWAEWCGPCRAMLPILEDLDEMLKKAEKEIKILKIDTNNGDLVGFLQAQNINSIPTFLVYQDENVIDRIIGALPKPKFFDFVSKYF